MVFKRFLLPFVISTLVLCAETDYRFAFPQSEILLGVDVKWLLKSQFGGSMRGEIKGNLGELQPLESLMDQIDSVHLSAVSKNNKSSDLLMLVQGRFEADKLIELAAKNGLRLEQWGKTKVLLQPKSRLVPQKKAGFQKVQFNPETPIARPAFALFDNKNIVIGEEAPLRVALERMETGLTPQANPLFERARDLEAENDVWLVGNTAPLNLNSGGSKPADPMMQMVSQIRNFSVGLAMRNNVSMDLQMQTTSPKAAARVLDLMKGAVAMAKMSSTPTEAFPVDLDKVLQITSSGNLVRAAISIDQAEVDKIMASGLVRGQTKAKTQPEPAIVSSTPVPAPAPVFVKPAAPSRKTVMIYGLPGGPKEVAIN